jgi:small conductance mechanosensitive channel
MSLLLLAQALGVPSDSGIPAPPLQPGTADWQNNALREFRAMDFGQLDHDEWVYVGCQYGLRALLVIVLMTLAWTLSGWASSLVRVGLSRVKFDETLTLFLAKLVRYVILLLVALSCLGYFGIQTTGFAAIIGAAGLAIGLAFQGTLSNFAAGAMLLIFRPYKVGDTVNVAGYSGKVGEIELFTTTIDTNDRRRVIIPNSAIFGAVIENITYHSVRRADVAVGTAYSADIDMTRAALERAVRNVATVVAEPAPEVTLEELGASSVNWSVRGFARRDQFGETKQALIRAVKLELDRSGIAIPFPQMEIHFEAPDEAVGRRAA